MGLPGDRRSVERLVDSYYVQLYRYAYRLCGKAVEAEDLAQETFCKAQASFSQLRDAACARAWLFQILRNVYLHRLRTEKTRPCLLLDDLTDIPDQSPDPMPVVDSEILQQALSELPEVYRTPVILYYFEDFSYRDIAEQMEVPLGTVMSRLSRARVHLRERLSRHVPELAQSSRRATSGM
jgi:RNA polymerase sigma-70 factor (ECF subfamily)